MIPRVNRATNIRDSPKLIREESRNLWAACKDYLGVLSEWDDRSILWLKAWLRFKALDAVVRILGVVETPDVNWRTVQEQAEARLCPCDGERLLDNLAHWHHRGGDPVLIRALLIYLLLHQAVQEDIKRRLAQRRYSKLWREYLARRTRRKGVSWSSE